MDYINPYLDLGCDLNTILEPATLKAVRERWTPLLSQSSETIAVNGREVSPISLQETMESLGNKRIMENHRKIARDKSLLKWLHGKMNLYKTPSSWGPLKNPEYAALILPPLGTQLGKRWKEALETQNLEDIEQLEELFRELPNAAMDYAGKVIGDWLKQRKDWMEGLVQGTQSLPLNFNRYAYEQYLTPQLGMALASLPPSHAEYGLGYLNAWSGWSAHLYKNRVIQQKWIQECWNKVTNRIEFPYSLLWQGDQITVRQIPKDITPGSENKGTTTEKSDNNWGLVFKIILILLSLLSIIFSR